MYKSINFVSTDNTETGDALGQPNIEKQFHQPKDLYLLQPVLSLGHLCTVPYCGVHALMRYFLLRVNNYALCIVSNSLTSKAFWISSIQKLDQQIYRYFFGNI